MNRSEYRLNNVSATVGTFRKISAAMIPVFFFALSTLLANSKPSPSFGHPGSNRSRCEVKSLSGNSGRKITGLLNKKLPPNRTVRHRIRLYLATDR